MSFGSVVLNILRNVDPLPSRRAGYGRVEIGLGSTAVTWASMHLPDLSTSSRTGRLYFPTGERRPSGPGDPLRGSRLVARRAPIVLYEE
ncbi:hypothetical protein GCM10009629_54610 [Pseudonocardia alni]